MVAVDFDQIAEALAAGTVLSASQLRDLAHSRDLIGLGMLAADVRAQRHGSRGTFVRVEVVDVSALPSDYIFDVPAEAGEVRLVGTASSLEAAAAAVRAARAGTTVPISGWSLDQLSSWKTPLVDTLVTLRDAGLQAVATARLDRLDVEHLRGVATAGLALQTVTLGTPVDDEVLVVQLEHLRAWQAATGVVRACTPLPVEMSIEQPTTGYDDMRHVAIARLVLDNVDHIQAHWTTMGAKLSQACLLFGANDVDAVPARDDMPHGPRRAILEEVRRNLLAASLDPVERDGGFQVRITA